MTTQTPILSLPLVQAAQAQKHVTVNEALFRVDALLQPRLVTLGLTAPPVDAEEGSLHAVGSPASGEWVGHEGALAIALNGGWVFTTPARGWRAADPFGLPLVFDGAQWRASEVLPSTGGATTRLRIVEADHTVLAGATSVTAPLIPARAQVLGVSARVIDPLTGTGLTGWKLGVAGSPDRHGAGLGIMLNAYAIGMTGQPVTYWSDTELLLTAEGGDFAGGTVRLAVHLSEITPPAMV